MTIQDLIHKWEDEIEMSEQIYKETGTEFFKISIEVKKRCLEESMTVVNYNPFGIP